MVVQLKDVEGYEPGQQLNPDEIFKVGEMVDIAGTTIGKGFQGKSLSPSFQSCIFYSRGCMIFSCSVCQRDAQAHCIYRACK